MKGNFYRNIGDLYLNDQQIDILKRKEIDINKFKSNKELIFFLESILNQVDDDELENISMELSEIDYYSKGNK